MKELFSYYTLVVDHLAVGQMPHLMVPQWVNPSFPHRTPVN
jgi:hypothetical protein